MQAETFQTIAQAWSGNPFWIVGTLAAVLALTGVLLDRRHMRRTDLDRVSLINWARVSGVAMIVAIVSVAMALRH